MVYFPDSETGYYEDERSFFDHDRELELAEFKREQRFEREAEEMQSTLWARPLEPMEDEEPTGYGRSAGSDGVDPETGCTTAEMKEEEGYWVPRQTVERASCDPAQTGGQPCPDEVSCERKVA